MIHEQRDSHQPGMQPPTAKRMEIAHDGLFLAASLANGVSRGFGNGKGIRSKQVALRKAKNEKKNPGIG
jgi:hypothetical protein